MGFSNSKVSRSYLVYLIIKIVQSPLRLRRPGPQCETLDIKHVTFVSASSVFEVLVLSPPVRGLG